MLLAVLPFNVYVIVVCKLGVIMGEIVVVNPPGASHVYEVTAELVAGDGKTDKVAVLPEQITPVLVPLIKQTKPQLVVPAPGVLALL